MNAGEELRYRYEDRDVAPIPLNPERLHIQNREIDEALVKFTFKNLPPVPQASVLVGIAVSFFLLITSIVAFRQAAPRVWALALSTAKNEMAQMLYLLLLLLGIVGVVIFSIYPFNTLGDDIRMFKDSGVTLIMVLGMIQAVWSAGTTCQRRDRRANGSDGVEQAGQPTLVHFGQVRRHHDGCAGAVRDHLGILFAADELQTDL